MLIYGRFRENVRRMFQMTLYRIAMIFVNICHILAIYIVIINIIASKDGGKAIIVKDDGVKQRL